MALKDDLIQSAVQKVKNFASGVSSKLSDQEGWFRGGQFTPIKQISEFSVGNNPTLGEATRQVLGQGLNNAFNPYARIAEGRSLAPLQQNTQVNYSQPLRIGADITNQGLKNYLSGITFNLVEPKMGNAQTTAGKITGIGTNLLGAFTSPASKFVFGKTGKFGEDLTRSATMKFAPKLAGTFASKVLPQVGGEVAQTLSYAGLSKLGNKLGLNEQQNQFSLGSLGTNLVAGLGFRAAPGLISKAISSSKGAFHPEDVNWLERANDVLRSKQSSPKAKQDAKNIIYSLSERYMTEPERVALGDNPKLLANRLIKYSKDIVGSGSEPIMGIKDQSQPVRTEISIKNFDDVSTSAYKYGWTAKPNANGEIELTNRLGKLVVTLKQKPDGSYVFINSSGDKVMSGRGQIGTSTERLIRDFYYGKLEPVIEPIKTGVGGEGAADRYTEIYDRLKNNKVVSSKDKNYVASISRDRKFESDSLLKQLQEDVKSVSDSQSAKDLIDKINQYNQLLDSTPPLNHRLRPTVPEWLMKKAKSNLSVTNNKPSWYSENSPRRAIYGNNKPPESLDNLSESELKKLYNDFMLALQKDKRSSDLYLITSNNRVSKSLEGRKTNEADTLRKEAFNELNAIKDRFYVADEKLPEFADDLRTRMEPTIDKKTILSQPISGSTSKLKTGFQESVPVLPLGLQKNNLKSQPIIPLSPSKVVGTKVNLPEQLPKPEPKLPWEEPQYIDELKSATNLKQETNNIKQSVKSVAESKSPSTDILPPTIVEDIKRTENLVDNKVNLLDWFRTPDRVLKKIGLGKEGEQIRASYNNYLDQLPKEIDKITSWYNEVDGSPESAKRLFQHLDGVPGVPLTPVETKVAGEMKAYLKDWADKLDLPEDQRVASYITHIFEKDFIKKEFDQDLAKIIADKVPGAVYDPFLQQRLGKQGYMEDVFRALDAYTKRAVRKYNMDPALEQLSKASNRLPLESFNYVKSYADRINLRPTTIDNYLDNLVKQSPVGYKLGQRPTTLMSRNMRQAVYRGTLGLNFGSALRNLTQGVNTYAKLGERYTAEGYLKVIPEILSGSNELKASGVLRDNLVQDRQMSAVKSVMEKVDKGLFSLFELAEKINRGSAYFGAKAKYLKEGLSESEAVKKAVDLVRDTQFTFGSVDSPVALQSDLVKTLTQFQSFNVKQTEFLTEMVKNKELAGAARWIGANLLIMASVGKLIGIDLKDIIPFGGILSGDSKLGQTPPFQLATDVYKAAINAPDKYGQTSEDPTLTRVTNAALKNAPAFIPAGVQIKKTIQGINAVNEGGSFSKSGRLQYPIEQTTGNYVRAGLFGKSNLEEAKNYFGSDNKVLGEKQTEQFRQSTDKQGFYKDVMDKRASNSQIEEARDAIRSGTQSQQVGDVIVYPTETGTGSLNLAKLDDIAKLPSTNRYEKAIKESKQYSTAATILDNNALTKEQRLNAVARLGLDPDKAEYYRIANDNTNAKTMFVLDSIDRAKTNGIDPLRLLQGQRTQINGQMIASNAVLDNLVDEGILSYAQAKELKKYKFENGQLVKMGKGRVSTKKIKIPKLKKIKVKSIKIKKAKKLKFKPVKLAKPKKIKVRRLANT